MTSNTDTVKVISAVFDMPKINDESFTKSVVPLRLLTEDRVEIVFDLDVMALALAGLTIGPAVRLVNQHPDNPLRQG